MERYLEGEEISHEEIVSALKDGHEPRRHLPGGVRRRHAEPGHEPPARRDRRGPALAREARRPAAAGGHARAGPRRRALRLRLQDEGRPVRRPDQLLPRLPGHDAPGRPGAQHPRPRQGAHRPAPDPARARTSKPADAFGPGDIGAVAKLKETRAGDWLAARDEPIAMPAHQAARSRSWPSRWSRTPRATRTRSSPRCGACRRRTRRSTCTATRRPASRSSPGSPRCTSRSSSTASAAASAPRSTSSRRACPTARRSARRPRPMGATRSRPAAAASSATATSRSSRCPRGATRTSSSSTRSRAASSRASFIPAVEKGCLEALPARRSRRLPGPGRARASLRRQLPLRRLLRDGLQDGRLAGDAPGARAGRLGPAGADHARHAVGARRRRGRRHRRPQQPPRAAAGHGAGGRPDRGQGRGADGGDADLRPRPALADRPARATTRWSWPATRRSRPTSRRRSWPSCSGRARPPTPEPGRGFPAAPVILDPS